MTKHVLNSQGGGQRLNAGQDSSSGSFCFVSAEKGPYFVLKRTGKKTKVVLAVIQYHRKRGKTYEFDIEYHGGSCPPLLYQIWTCGDLVVVPKQILHGEGENREILELKKITRLCVPKKYGKSYFYVYVQGESFRLACHLNGTTC